MAGFQRDIRYIMSCANPGALVSHFDRVAQLFLEIIMRHEA